MENNKTYCTNKYLMNFNKWFLSISQLGKVLATGRERFFSSRAVAAVFISGYYGV
jgi:hypothetical protein